MTEEIAARDGYAIETTATVTTAAMTSTSMRREEMCIVLTLRAVEGMCVSTNAVSS